jgi:hypothetical protein
MPPLKMNLLLLSVFMVCKVFKKTLNKNTVYGFYQMLQAVFAFQEYVFASVQAEQAKAKGVKHCQEKGGIFIFYFTLCNALLYDGAYFFKSFFFFGIKNRTELAVLIMQNIFQEFAFDRQGKVCCYYLFQLLGRWLICRKGVIGFLGYVPVFFL